MMHTLITVLAVAVTAVIVWKLARRPAVAELSEDDRAALEGAYAEAAAARDAAENTQRQVPELGRTVVEMYAEVSRAVARVARPVKPAPPAEDAVAGGSSARAAAVGRPRPRLQAPARIVPGTAPIRRATRPAGRSVGLGEEPTALIAAVPASAGQCSPPGDSAPAACE